MKFDPKKVILLILDGWGMAKPDKYNAIDNANTPNFDKLVRAYPNVNLRADGEYVGLPEGQFGTSEINHQVIGTGQVVLQDLPKIDKAIEEGSFFDNEIISKAFHKVNDSNSKLHIIGILSDGKVHCSIDHAINLIRYAASQNVKRIYFHVFTDGRDTPPQSAHKYIDKIEKELSSHSFESAKIATMQGRFYLDRDRDWEKTDKAVSLMVDGHGKKFNSAEAVVNYSYHKSITDEFIGQSLLDEDGMISQSDAVIFFHYRTDRMFQIQARLLERNIKDIEIISFVDVLGKDEIEVAFPRDKISQTLAGVISDAGKDQYHITETEKYTHLTFFLNAGRSEEYQGETWEMIKSNRFFKPFYNFVPSMQADSIAKKIIGSIKHSDYDFIIANFSNTDMVGHTGNYEAAKIAAESVDYSIGQIYQSIKDNLGEYALIITSDHGNSDEMWDYKNDQPHTQHTTNPVPFVLVSDIDCKLDRRESLEDIAPTVLDLMGLEKPEVMTGNSLILEKK